MTTSTDIHEIVRHGTVAELRRLIATGANVNQPDPEGQTPLDIAIAYGRIAAADVLRRAGAF